VRAADGHFPAGITVDLGGNLIGGQQILIGQVLGQGFVLVLGEERRLAPIEPQVEGVLDGGQLIGMMPLRPGDDRTFIRTKSISDRLMRSTL
jgi:hypothetical protein